MLARHRKLIGMTFLITGNQSVLFVRVVLLNGSIMHAKMLMRAKGCDLSKVFQLNLHYAENLGLEKFAEGDGTK